MLLNPKLYRGQALLKFLWQHSLYQTKNGVSPVLASDLLAIAINSGLVSDTKTLNTATIFNWINGSVIPKWARLSAFTLAMRHGWKPVDKIDVLSVLFLDTKRTNTTPLDALIAFYADEYQLCFPRAIVSKISKEWSELIG
jgi:hypothetical protein